MNVDTKFMKWLQGEINLCRGAAFTGHKGGLNEEGGNEVGLPHSAETIISDGLISVGATPIKFFFGTFRLEIGTSQVEI